MLATFQFLGTGASAGVPVIGCKCEVCSSTSLKNKRFRPSGLIRVEEKAILVDIGPDFWSQANKFGVDSIDGLILTHTHYDHIAGIDELRIFNVRQKKAMPCLLSLASYEELQKRYYYFFDPKGLSAKLDCQTFQDEMGVADFLGLKIGYCNFFQSSMKVSGFRLGEFAYISDIQKYEDSIFDALQGVKTLVISALRPEKTPFHLSFDEAIQFSNRIEAKNTYITHLAHFTDHEAMNALLPPNMQVAFDGLTLEFKC